MIHLLSETLRRSRDVGCCEPATHEFTALEPTGAFAGGHLPNGRAPREAVTPLGQRGPRDSECGLFSQTLGSGSPARVGRAPLETTCSGPHHWVPASTESSADRARQAARGAVGSSAAGDSSQTPRPSGRGSLSSALNLQPPPIGRRAAGRRRPLGTCLSPWAWTQVGACAATGPAHSARLLQPRASLGHRAPAPCPRDRGRRWCHLQSATGSMGSWPLVFV